MSLKDLFFMYQGSLFSVTDLLCTVIPSILNRLTVSCLARNAHHAVLPVQLVPEAE